MEIRSRIDYFVPHLYPKRISFSESKFSLISKISKSSTSSALTSIISLLFTVMSEIRIGEVDCEFRLLMNKMNSFLFRFHVLMRGL